MSSTQNFLNVSILLTLPIAASLQFVVQSAANLYKKERGSRETFGPPNIVISK